jgi:hypothetical protein
MRDKIDTRLLEGGIRMARSIAAVPTLMCIGMIALIAIAPGQTTTARAQVAPDSITVTIEELNGSGVHGTAVLTASGDQTLVALDVVGVAGEHPDHIHRSSCDNPEPNPLYPLSDVVLSEANPRGHSETLVDVSLNDLLADPHLILIHKSKEEIGVYLACANIVTSAVDMPNTGIGVATAEPAATVAWLFAIGAAVLVGLGVLTRRRRVI